MSETLSIKPPIPFNRPSLQGGEIEYIREAIRRGHLSGDGFFCKEIHKLMEKELSVSRALLTPSCTAALEMSALLLDIQPGDEVIIPSYTFVSTANAFALRGAKIVFADISPATLNLDESLLEGLITEKTRAIVPVHYAGVACEMDAIGAIAGKHGLAVIEDNAHGMFGKYKGRYLGTFGQMATQSFHETKNFSCGEGGALLINDPGLVSRAEIIREKGTNRANFFRGQVDKYSWVDLGSSYLPSELQAAYLLGQLEARQKIQEHRRRIWSFYRETLSEWAEANGVGLPTIPEHREHTYHLFYLLLPSLEIRTRFIDHLKRLGIVAVFHYLPLHLSEMARRYGSRPGDCPVTEGMSDRLVRLPLFNDMTDSELGTVGDAVRSFRV